MLEETKAVRAPAHMPRDEIDTNKYSGAYILAMHLYKAREDFKIVNDTEREVTKIYRLSDRLYVVPQRNEAPPRYIRWVKIGRKYGRNIFKSQ